MVALGVLSGTPSQAGRRRADQFHFAFGGKAIEFRLRNQQAFPVRKM